jgi:hypothetical protein
MDSPSVSRMDNSFMGGVSHGPQPIGESALQPTSTAMALQRQGTTPTFHEQA